jgi:hypothetical protein
MALVLVMEMVCIFMFIIIFIKRLLPRHAVGRAFSLRAKQSIDYYIHSHHDQKRMRCIFV